jgi:hypothetical protein
MTANVTDAPRSSNALALADPVCFALPAEIGDGGFRLARWLAIRGERNGPEQLRPVVREPLARVLASMVCGEESAVRVFHAQSRRSSGVLACTLRSALAQIAAEERIHFDLLQWLRMRLPPASDVERIRARARRFLMRLQSRDVATHFARVVGIDGAVCRIARAIMRSDKVAPSSLTVEIFRRILRDESRHVRISRNYSVALGLSRRDAAIEREFVGYHLKGALEPLADAFETIGVDPDRLFWSIGGGDAGDLSA